MKPFVRATLIGASAIVLWGTLAPLTALTGGRIPPFQLLAASFTLAFALMLLRWRLQGHWGLARARQPLAAWLLGVGGLFGYHACYFAAMQRAPAVQVSLIAYLWPLLIVLFAALLPGARLRVRHLVGAALALGGVWVLLGGNAGFDSTYVRGYLLAAACALIWSAYSVLSRLLPRVPSEAVGWFCGATALFAWVAHFAWEPTLWPDGAMGWCALLALGLGPVGVAFFTWDHGVKHGDIALLGVLSYAAPLISVVLLVLLGLAEPSARLGAAALAIVGGSLVAGWEWRKRAVSSFEEVS